MSERSARPKVKIDQDSALVDGSVEKWKPVVGYEGLYEVSSKGGIFSLYKMKPMKLKLHPTGYYYISLCKGSRNFRTHKVHRLVLEAFVGTSSLLGCHRNHVRTDNRVENLYWATHRQNLADSAAAGRMRPGEKSNFAKLTSAQVATIKKAASVGVPTKFLAAIAKTSDENIRLILKGKTWRHTDQANEPTVEQWRIFINTIGAGEFYE